MANKARVQIATEDDIIEARQRGRLMATEVGFSGSEATMIAAAIREVAKNIVDYAQHGEMLLDRLENGPRQGLQIVARDTGPGIPDVSQAMQYGFSTLNRLGAGLPGAKWLMDEFDIVSSPAEGTTVTMTKWLKAFANHDNSTQASGGMGLGQPRPAR